MPATIRPPDNYYYSEATLSRFHAYDVSADKLTILHLCHCWAQRLAPNGIFTLLLLVLMYLHADSCFALSHALTAQTDTLLTHDQVARWRAETTTEAAIQYLTQTGHATLRWAKFNHEIYQALQNPQCFDSLLHLMRRAPDELHYLMQVQPPNMTNNINQFLSTCTTPYPHLHEDELRQIRAVTKSLIKYAAEISKSPPVPHPNLPSPSHQTNHQTQHHQPTPSSPS